MTNEICINAWEAYKYVDQHMIKTFSQKTNRKKRTHDDNGANLHNYDHTNVQWKESPRKHRYLLLLDI